MLVFFNLILFGMLMISFGLILMLLLLPSKDEIHGNIIIEINEVVNYLTNLLKQKEFSLKHISDCLTSLWVLFILMFKLCLVYILLTIDDVPSTSSTEDNISKKIVGRKLRTRARRKTRKIANKRPKKVDTKHFSR